MNQLPGDIITVLTKAIKETYRKLIALTCHRFYELFHTPLSISDLLFLCESGDIKLLEILLPSEQIGVSVYAEAAARGDQPDTLSFLVRKGFLLGDAISEAAGSGHLELVRNIYSGEINQAMEKAAFGGHLDIVKWFISMGHYVGGSVLVAARSGGHEEVERWILNNLPRTVMGTMFYPGMPQKGTIGTLMRRADTQVEKSLIVSVLSVPAECDCVIGSVD